METWVAVIGRPADVAAQERLVLALHVREGHAVSYLGARGEWLATHSGWLETEAQGDTLTGSAEALGLLLEGSRETTADGLSVWEGELWSDGHRYPWQALPQVPETGLGLFEAEAPGCRAGVVVWGSKHGDVVMQGNGL